MIKSEELTNPKSCMSRAADQEMTFVLLARDVVAPETIRFWAAQRVTRAELTKWFVEQLMSWNRPTEAAKVKQAERG